MKAINLELSERLHAKVKAYAAGRELPVVGVIRMVLSDFFRNKSFDMKTNEELPEGIVDRGEDSGYVIDLEYFRDANGVCRTPPPNLTKGQTLDWIRKNHNGKKSDV